MLPKDIGALQRRLTGNGYSHPERSAIAVARRRQSKAFCLHPIPIDRTKKSPNPPWNSSFSAARGRARGDRVLSILVSTHLPNLSHVSNSVDRSCHVSCHVSSDTWHDDTHYHLLDGGAFELNRRLGLWGGDTLLSLTVFVLLRVEGSIQSITRHGRFCMSGSQIICARESCCLSYNLS